MRGDHAGTIAGEDGAVEMPMTYATRCCSGLVLAIFLALWGGPADAQTPSPFSYWQNAAGIVLAPMGGPVPDWRATLGLGAAGVPRYEGSGSYRLVPAPAFDLRYRNLVFLSSGDGLGINLISGETYRAGVAVGYDVGRSQHATGRLNGIGSISPSPDFRIFAEVTLFPVVVSINLRHPIGGYDGLVGDIGLYMPVIGNDKLVVFAGPSVGFGDANYMQAYFGITPAQAAGSNAHLAVYSPSGGLKSVGVGVSAIYHFTDQWFVDAGVSFERLVASAGNSPVVEDRDQAGASLIIGYDF
jgi:outer membrane scaffolding protein for murein synthesis (MipA/OmpV family)